MNTLVWSLSRLIYRNGAELQVNRILYALYPTSRKLEQAINVFRAEDFSESLISVLLPPRQAANTWTLISGNELTEELEEATTRSIIDIMMSGTLGWLDSLGAVPLPGIGPLIAAGPLVGSIARDCVDPKDTLASGLQSLGLPARNASCYESRILAGGSLLSIRVNNPVMERRAWAIFEETDGEEISSSPDRTSPFATIHSLNSPRASDTA